jgi:hypothetical protein
MQIAQIKLPIEAISAIAKPTKGNIARDSNVPFHLILI